MSHSSDLTSAREMVATDFMAVMSLTHMEVLIESLADDKETESGLSARM